MKRSSPYCQRRVRRCSEGKTWKLTGNILDNFIEIRSMKSGKYWYMKLEDYTDPTQRYPTSIPIYPRLRLVKDGIVEE